MRTLKARKEYLSPKDVGKYLAGWQTTFTDMEGNIKAVIGTHLRQPRKGIKQITLNCNQYALIWD